MHWTKNLNAVNLLSLENLIYVFKTFQATSKTSLVNFATRIFCEVL